MNKNLKIILIAVAGAWLVVGGIFLSRRGACGSHGCPKKASVEAEVGALRNEVTELRGKIEELEGEEVVEDSANADELLQRAQETYVHGDYARALFLAKLAADEQPAKAYRIIGASHCFLKDAAGAKQAWSKLDPQGQRFLHYVCQRNNVALP